MIQNPFQSLDNRLSNIESLLLDIKHKPQLFSTENQSEKEEMLTREEVCRLAKITPPTCIEYDKKGLLIPYRFGRGVRYKRSEVFSALKAIHTKKEGVQA